MTLHVSSFLLLNHLIVLSRGYSRSMDSVHGSIYTITKQTNKLSDLTNQPCTDSTQLLPIQYPVVIELARKYSFFQFMPFYGFPETFTRFLHLHSAHSSLGMFEVFFFFLHLFSLWFLLELSEKEKKNYVFMPKCILSKAACYLNL